MVPVGVADAELARQRNAAAMHAITSRARRSPLGGMLHRSSLAVLLRKMERRRVDLDRDDGRGERE
jgi:hypothetical protein